MTRRRALVLGSSGVLGIAWTLGTLAGIEEETGWDAREADLIVGTSGGSLIATLLRAGYSVPELCEAHLAEIEGVLPDEMAEDVPTKLAATLATQPARPPLPWPTPGSVRLAARGLLTPWRTPPLATLAGLLPRGRGSLDHAEEFVAKLQGGPAREDTQVVAMNHRTGERTVFGRPGEPEAEHARAVIASMAFPGWFTPVRVGRDRYVDGGLCSPCSADLADDADEVFVLAPLAGVALTRPRSPLALADWAYRCAAARMVEREASMLQAGGAEVRAFAPDAEALAVLGRNMMNGAARCEALRFAHDHPTELVA
ncbi:patatin-like phospholipase family protein [Sporichthya polymorpha]|uniref:patatin-like phospholipase family protein n=1 Tax=Sporichthya polymorpha TaxID=35751 RepID=UPI0003A77ACC|nr:patatin-like phospholipase family protein [Sporichthya polymorpha]